MGLLLMGLLKMGRLRSLEFPAKIHWEHLLDLVPVAAKLEVGGRSWGPPSYYYSGRFSSSRSPTPSSLGRTGCLPSSSSNARYVQWLIGWPVSTVCSQTFRGSSPSRTGYTTGDTCQPTSSYWTCSSSRSRGPPWVRISEWPHPAGPVLQSILRAAMRDGDGADAGDVHVP